MKKKVLISTLMLCFVGLNVFFALNNQKSDICLSRIFSVKLALADDEGGGGATWVKTTSDCSITVYGEAGVTFKLFGVTYTIPAEGSITIKFSDIAVDCASGGSQMCEYYTCADFWKGSDS
jgi:hypothetical protein